MTSRLCVLAATLAALLCGAATAAPPAPPTGLHASDHPLDGGEQIDLTWVASADDASVTGYRVLRTMNEAEAAAADDEAARKAADGARADATRLFLAAEGTPDLDPADLTVEQKGRLRAARESAAAEAQARAASTATGDRFKFVGLTQPHATSFTVDKLHRGQPYRFRVLAVGAGGVASEPAETAEAIAPTRQGIDGSRFALAVITAILCGAVFYWILHARSGRPIKVRKIAGLEAVDEAVGRATEMGRSCLFVPGIQDMNDIQTIAGLTVLSRVAKTAAEYDAKIEVPTSRSLVMTAARETVQASFLSAGRPDAYNQDHIYYVTDEQFGYVAYLSGMMVREKPAACFYMGCFFAESLILAETGNSIGAIQIAGTAQPAQLPFFVAACDYTLIGEEFFAASAYLSGSAEELGSLKGQDVGKIVVAIGMLVGITVATIASVTGSATFAGIADYIRNSILT